MSSVNKYEVPVLIATYIAGRLYPDSPALLNFVKFGAASENVANRRGQCEFFFADLVCDLLKKEGKSVNEKTLRVLGKEIVETINVDKLYYPPGDFYYHTPESIIEEIFEQIITRQREKEKPFKL